MGKERKGPADAKTPWYSRLFRRQKGEEPETGQPKPKLWFSSNVPYKYEMMAYGQLHPELSDEVDKILFLNKASRIGLAATASLPLMSASAPILLAAGLAQAANIHKNMPRVLWEEQDPKKSAKNAIEIALSTLFLPYIFPREKTLGLGKKIKAIAERGESPFSREDTAELLKNYHYGIVDNEGNLALLQHPFDSSARPLSGWEKLNKWAQWHHPFQRTRFELQKPKIREKERYKAMRLKPAYASAQLRMAPIRVR